MGREGSFKIHPASLKSRSDLSCTVRRATFEFDSAPASRLITRERSIRGREDDKATSTNGANERRVEKRVLHESKDFVLSADEVSLCLCVFRCIPTTCQHARPCKTGDDVASRGKGRERTQRVHRAGRATRVVNDLTSIARGMRAIPERRRVRCTASAIMQTVAATDEHRGRHAGLLAPWLTRIRTPGHNGTREGDASKDGRVLL
jgi:hypothetical protein